MYGNPCLPGDPTKTYKDGPNYLPQETTECYTDIADESPVRRCVFDEAGTYDPNTDRAATCLVLPPSPPLALAPASYIEVEEDSNFSEATDDESLPTTSDDDSSDDESLLTPAQSAPTRRQLAPSCTPDADRDYDDDGVFRLGDAVFLAQVTRCRIASAPARNRRHVARIVS